MERRSKKRNSAYKREQRRHANRKCRGHNSDSEVSALRQALQSAKKSNQKLTSTNINLGQQVKELKRMEISWVKQKGKLMHEKDCIHRIFETKYHKARNEINRLEEALRAAGYHEEQIDKKNEEIKESQKEKAALQERIRLQSKMINTVQSFWEKENKQLQSNFEITMNEVKAELDNQWSLREEQITAELKDIQMKCLMQQEEIVRKGKLITRLLKERLDLMKDVMQTAIQVHEKDDAYEQSEKQWKLKCESLEVRLRREQAKREEGEKEPAPKKMKSLFWFRRKNRGTDRDGENNDNDA